MSAIELASDLYGTIAARMHNSSAGERSWGFTSTTGEEGATSVALGTALALTSLQSERVLLIDANWLSPSLSAFARTTNRPDLDACLRSNARLPEALVPTRVPTLFLLTSRALATESPLGLLPAVVAEATAQFRHVLVDLPPILRATALVMSWAAVLGQFAVVVRRDKTRRAVLKRALETVAPIREPVVVLNGAKIDDHKGRAKQRG
jgi:Mrp family chromosome partitioning ATPase